MVAFRLLALLLVTIVSSVAHGSAQRTFVSIAGDDANAAANCSLAAPCRSFDAAIGATLDGGELVVLESGGYGSVTITQSVTIEAPPGVYAGVSVLTGTGVVVNAPGGTVKLRGLTINGLGGDRGISVFAVGSLHVARTHISNMAQYGIFASAAADMVVISDTTVTDSVAQSGVVLFNAAAVDIERLHIVRSGGAGLYLSDVGKASVRDSALIDSGRSGFLNPALHVSTSAGGVVSASIQRVTVHGAATDCLIVQGQNAGSTVFVDVTQSVFTSCALADASHSGIRGFGASTGIVHVVVDNSIVRNSAGYGIDVLGTGSTLTVSRSTLVDNANVGLRRASGTLYTRGDNTVRGNNGQETTGQTSGTITSLTPL